MTHSIDTPIPPPTSGATPVSATTSTTQSTTPSTTDVAKDQAGNVASTAKQAGSQVASTAADQAKQVTQETKRQAQDLVQQGRQQLQQQARTGQQKAGQGLNDIAQQLRLMVQGGGETPSGPAADLVSQAGDKVEQLASWISDREPGDLVVELRNFARRKPGVFLLGAAVAGVVAGRLTTGMVAAHKDESSSGTTGTYGTTGGTYGTTGYAAQPATTPVPTYAEEGYAGTNYATDTTTSGYTTGTTGSVPPPPYGTVPPAGTTPGTTGGFDDPLRTGEVGRP